MDRDELWTDHSITRYVIPGNHRGRDPFLWPYAAIPPWPYAASPLSNSLMTLLWVSSSKRNCTLT
jgi:hypothetical protein